MTEKIPKYFRIKWNGWDYVASPIHNDNELKLWLEDGSLGAGDEVFEVSKKFITKVKETHRPKLKLVEVEK